VTIIYMFFLLLSASPTPPKEGLFPPLGGGREGPYLIISNNKINFQKIDAQIIKDTKVQSYLVLEVLFTISALLGRMKIRKFCL